MIVFKDGNGITCMLDDDIICVQVCNKFLDRVCHWLGIRWRVGVETEDYYYIFDYPTKQAASEAVEEIILECSRC